MRPPLTIFLFLVTLLAGTPAHAQDLYAEAQLTSRHLIPGEQTHLIIRVHGGRPDYKPTTPEIPGTAVNFVRTVTQLDAQRQLTQVYLYRLTPAKAGKFTLPPISLSSGGKPLQTPSITFQVHDITSLTPLTTGINNHKILVGCFPAKTSLYPGEQCPLTLKLYVPERLRIVHWGLPDATKKNCLAWRFSLPQHRGLSQVSINGIAHLTEKYTTTLSGIRPGKATFGPANLRLIARRRIIDPRFGSRITDTQLPLTLPAKNFTILPFPDGAPAGFNGAVGHFKINAECAKLTLTESDSTEVTLRIAGTGNLENLSPPALSDNSWKIIDTSKVTRGEERRYISGMVTFRQLIRPNINSTFNIQNSTFSIPAYTLSYFNPADQSYHTLETPPIPVSVTPPAHKPSTTPEATSTPPEEMRGILGFINKTSLENPPFKTLNPKLHILPALLALLVIAVPLRKKLKAATTQSPDTQSKDKALAQLRNTTDTRRFYRLAGRFIDRWLTPSPETASILTERDSLCFQPDSTELTPIPPERRKEILALLRHSSKLIITLVFLLCTHTLYGSPSEARDAWKSRDYQNAINLYQKTYPDPAHTPADILYNIGNCHHRLDRPGHAALAWRRALATDPTHHQTRQNLRFVEITEGSQAPTYPAWQLLLARISPGIYQIIFHTALWLTALPLLALICLRPKKKIMALCIILIVLAPVLATLGGLAGHYYPDYHTFAPLNTQALTLEETNLYTDAHHHENDPPKLPTASLVRINATRGPWTHITTTGNKTGWVESPKIGKIK